MPMNPSGLILNRYVRFYTIHGISFHRSSTSLLAITISHACLILLFRNQLFRPTEKSIGASAGQPLQGGQSRAHRQQPVFRAERSEWAEMLRDWPEEDEGEEQPDVHPLAPSPQPSPGHSGMSHRDEGYDPPSPPSNGARDDYMADDYSYMGGSPLPPGGSQQPRGIQGGQEAGEDIQPVAEENREDRQRPLHEGSDEAQGYLPCQEQHDEDIAEPVEDSRSQQSSPESHSDEVSLPEGERLMASIA